MRRQMTSCTAEMVRSSTSKETTWRSIDWKRARREVRRLQMRIAKAVQAGDHGKVKSLQWTLTHSFYAKALAVKRVTSNQGKNTPGVDGILWKTAKDKMKAIASLRQHGYKAQPLRRTYITKKNGKMRPLSIPTMVDRAMQALYKLALAPVAEITADRNLYGFREGRSCADAVAAAFNNILRGWANYHRHVVSSDVFRRVDSYVYEQLWRMLRRRHSNKSKKWLSRKYWRAAGKKGVFAIIVRYKNKLKLYQVIRICSIGIRRHRKIKADANPYLPEYGRYFWIRRHVKEAKLWRELTARQLRLALY